MRSTPSPTPVRAGGPAGRRAAGRRFLAAPVHLALALGLVTGCASSTASTTPAPVPGTVSTVPASASPTASTPASTSTSPAAPPPLGTVTRVGPAPAETPVPAAVPLAGARLDLERLPVAAAGTMSDYDREALFGGWIDADGDCEDTRNEVLARDLTDITSAEGCTVATGTLSDPYTGSTIAFVRGAATSGDVQVDHVVSLGNAWITGARRLTQTERVALANDPLNLLAVDGPANGSKSDLDASGWLPPNKAFACGMVATQIAVKARYGLWVTAPEKQAMTEVLADCPAQRLPGGTPFGDITGDAPAAPMSSSAPSPTPEVPVPTDVHYQDCAAAREAGYGDAMDRDADGVACEG
ncbi:GmrSD restriction endonuclease domain-containing protein [Kocuria turfanensis]|uniref:GmrSD restriction endonuclease domain-containing protein n=1 Tax=Kocuria turfanensis TaxID=388357 RepID=UPI0040367B27